MSELMPCPFCPPDESDPKLIHPGTFMFYVKCCSCGCMSGPVCMTAEQAEARWNTRHERMVEPAVYIDIWITNTDPRWIAECGCGATLCEGRSERDVRYALPPYCSECGAKVVEE